MSSSKKHCFLCSAKKTPENHLHRFPKSPALRSAWISFCGLSETDNVRNVYLCSSHFVPSDYRWQGALRCQTVPSVLRAKKKSSAKKLQQPLFLKLEITHSDDVEESTPGPLELLSPKKEPKEEPPEFIDFDQQLELPKELPKYEDGLKLELPRELPKYEDGLKLELPRELPKYEDGLKLELEPPKPLPERVDVGLQTDLMSPKLFPKDVEDGQETAKERKIGHPRYMGDITLADIATPEGARSCLLMAKSKIDEKSCQLKMVHQQNRRLRKKVQKLTDLLKEIERNE